MGCSTPARDATRGPPTAPRSRAAGATVRCVPLARPAVPRAAPATSPTPAPGRRPPARATSSRRPAPHAPTTGTSARSTCAEGRGTLRGSVDDGVKVRACESKLQFYSDGLGGFERGFEQGQAEELKENGRDSGGGKRSGYRGNTHKHGLCDVVLGLPSAVERA